MAGYDQHETFQPPGVDVGAGRVGAALSDALNEFTNRARQTVEPVLAQRAAIQGEQAGKERQNIKLKPAFGPVGQAFQNAYIRAYTLGVYADTAEDFAKLEAESAADPAKFMALSQARSKAIMEQVPPEIRPFIGDVLDKRTQEARGRIIGRRITQDQQTALFEFTRGITTLNDDISRGLTSGTVDGIERAHVLGGLLTSSIDSAVADGIITPAEGEKAKYESLTTNARNVELGNFVRVLGDAKADPAKYIENFLKTDHPLMNAQEVQQVGTEMLRRLEQQKHLQEFGHASQRGELSDHLQDMENAASQGLPVSANVQLHSQLLDAFGPYEGEQRFKHAQHLVTLSGVVGRMNAQPGSSIVATVAGYKPTKVEGATEQRQLYELVARQGSAILEARVKDPAGYLAQYDPATAATWAEFLKDSGNTQRRDDYLKALRSAKASLQIAGGQILPEAYAQSLVQTLNDPKSAEFLNVAVSAEKDKWGDAWPQVYQQIAKSIPDMAMVLGSGVPQSAGDALAATASLDTKQMESMLPSGTKMKDVEDKIGQAFDDLRRSFPPEAGGIRQYNAILDSARRLTIINSKTMGLNGAVEAAYKALADYTFNDFRGVTYRVPREYDAELIDDGARAFLENFKPSSNAVLKTPGSQLSAEETLDMAQESIRDNAYYVTRPDGQGVRLYQGGVPVPGPDGKIDLTWDELTALGLASTATRPKLTPDVFKLQSP